MFYCYNIKHSMVASRNLNESLSYTTLCTKAQQQLRWATVATIDIGRKEGAAVPLSRELGLRLVQCGLSRGLLQYQAAASSIQPFCHNRHWPKIGAEVEIWRIFSLSNAKINRKRPHIAEISCPIRKSGSRNRMMMSEL